MYPVASTIAAAAAGNQAILRSIDQFGAQAGLDDSPALSTADRNLSAIHVRFFELDGICLAAAPSPICAAPQLNCLDQSNGSRPCFTAECSLGDYVIHHQTDYVQAVPAQLCVHV